MCRFQRLLGCPPSYSHVAHVYVSCTPHARQGAELCAMVTHMNGIISAPQGYMETYIQDDNTDVTQSCWRMRLQGCSAVRVCKRVSWGSLRENTALHEITFWLPHFQPTLHPHL